MNRPVAILRPEPGNAQTAARVAARGLTPIRLPLFAVAPIAWDAPDPTTFDALLLTSANTLRHGGKALAALNGLPALAVGHATAVAARAAGFDVVATGDGNAADLARRAAALGMKRALHLGGRDTAPADNDIVACTIAVYASEPIAIAADRLIMLDGAVVLLHSARASGRLAALVDEAGLARSAIRLAAISGAACAAVGRGWAALAISPAPTDAALIDAAARLTD